MIVYYARIDSNPESKTYQQPRSLFRWTEGQDIKLERFDGEKWVDYPGLLAATGIGGSHDFVEIAEDEALELLEKLGGKQGHKGYFTVLSRRETEEPGVFVYVVGVED